MGFSLHESKTPSGDECGAGHCAPGGGEVCFEISSAPRTAGRPTGQMGERTRLEQRRQQRYEAAIGKWPHSEVSAVGEGVQDEQHHDDGDDGDEHGGQPAYACFTLPHCDLLTSCRTACHMI